MALLTCDFFSEVLEVGTSVTVVLPQASTEQIGVSGVERTGDPPVLYLLHGLSDDHTAWLRYTSIERYAAPLGLAVVMPQVQRSFYADEISGGRYWTYLVRGAARGDRRVPAGLRPARGHVRRGPVDGRVRRAEVGAAAARTVRRDGQPVRRARPRGAEPQRATTAVRAGLRRPRSGRATTSSPCWPTPTSTTLPSVYVGCGTEDALYDGSVRFVDEATVAGVDVQRRLPPGRARVGAVGRDDPRRPRLAPPSPLGPDRRVPGDPCRARD